MIDLLFDIISGKIDVEKAYEVYDSIINKFHSGKTINEPRDELGLDKYEWTAFCHGANFAKLAEWRKFGWPKLCSKCHKPINYKNFGWIIVDNGLQCIHCI